MKKLLIIPIFLFSLICSAATYYVSTTGSNSSSGTMAQPFLTIQYGVDHLTSPGDILYIRGGTYYSTSSTIVNITSSNGSGTSGNTKKVYAYPGEKVIIDGTNQSVVNSHYGINVQNVNYWDFKGLNITNILERNASCYGEGFDLNNSSNITIENCSVYHCAHGFFNAWGANITYENCDAYDNANIGNDDPGGYADGFTSHTHGTSVVIYDGCRAWLNSDDGFDTYGSSGYITFNNCWAFNNGYGNDNNGNIKGNGGGFKTGANDTYVESGVQRIIANCLSFNNLGYGFDKSQDGGPSMLHKFFNNTIYNNGTALNFQYAGASDIIRNNICYANTAFYPVNSNNTADHNNFSNTSQKGSISTTDADFLSVDPAGTDGPRQADGSLPVLNFLKLASGSKLINAGADLSLPYSGSAPDLGAFETQLSTAPANPPAYVSSAVDNATPSVIGMTYNLSLALTVPASSAFSVKVNSVARTVNTVTISGTKVLLTLASPVVNGDAITVAYTQPATNLLQGVSGDKAATLSAQTVTNNTVSTIKDATSGIIKMTITPNRIHHFISIQFEYSSSFSAQNAAFSPQIIRIFNVSGKLVAEKLLVTGVANAVIPINLKPGIYTVLTFSGGLQMATQKIVVY